MNQNQTYKQEIAGDYLWSPKTNSNGGRNRFYDAMKEAEPGDVVFSFCDAQIRAVGVVSDRCDTAPKPVEFGATGTYWSHEGWYLPVQFTELAYPIRPKDHMAELAPTLPAKYSPLQVNGNGNQGVYLAPVPAEMADVLRRLLAGQVEAVEGEAVLADAGADSAAAAEEARVRADETIPTTERLQLIKARVGQGLFRSQVELVEPRCRLTGVSDKRMLRASHIKPWSLSTHPEKLDGANGLMLSPHVDHLFDQGFISFQDDGTLIISAALPREVLSAWGIGESATAKGFSQRQAAFLSFHREHVLRH